MSTLRFDAGHTKDEVDAFLDLVLGDDDLLAAEFEAIIRASWKRPVSRRRPASSGRDGRERHQYDVPTRAKSRSRERGRDGHGCQRGPPPHDGDEIRRGAVGLPTAPVRFGKGLSTGLDRVDTASVDLGLLDQVVRRESLVAPGKSGALLERCWLDDGSTIVVKHADARQDWISEDRSTRLTALL